jgi:hypothetical protein
MQTDRWMEMDLFFFQEKPFGKQAREVMERLAPLYQNVEGDCGIVLCCAWLCDLVTEWRGSGDQPLPFRTPTAANWSKRTYDDLLELLAALRSAAEEAGITRFKLGIMMVAWGNFAWGEGGGYDMQSGWYDRHPEIYFKDGWKNIDYRKRLKRDSYAYASLSSGIGEGMSFAEFFAGQWSLLSRFLKLDAIHFRDGFLGRAIYEMEGPFGTSGPEKPADAEEWSRELVAFFAAAKRANPDCTVMLYSSARSPVGEYRAGCFDLEALVASNAIDVWIDQTWAGAWQDWWSQEFRGWTFQLANVIAHHVMIAAGNAKRKVPCRHYHLVETWDAWEPWDTLHQVPGKLRWGIWAFSHAAVKTPTGLSRTDGTYISWAHNWENQFLSAEDIAFLQKNLDEATENANGMEDVYGPSLALNLPRMRELQKSVPHLNAGDLIDDQCAMLMKWAFPCLSGVGMEAAPVASEGYVLQTPAHLSEDWYVHLHQDAVAYIAAGPAQHIDPRLLADIGVEDLGEAIKVGKQHLYPPPHAADVLPQVYSVCMPPNRALAPGKSEVVARTSKTILIAQSHQAARFLWQPQHPFVSSISYLCQSQYGSLAPFVALVRAWHRAGRRTQSVHVEDLPAHLPVAFHLWRSRGSIYLLVGNLETGIVGDSRLPRALTFTLNKSKLDMGAGPCTLEDRADGTRLKPQTENALEVTFSIEVAPQESLVLQVRKDAGQDISQRSQLVVGATAG